jgi:CheY-like chemotaxis protein
MPHVLLCEDDDLLGPALESFLIRRGYTVTLCPSVADAIEQVENNKNIDAVILDIMMNGDPDPEFIPTDPVIAKHRMGGLRVAKRVPRGIPILVLSGADHVEVMRAAQENVLEGAMYWFSKPPDYERLLRALDTAATAKRERSP